MLFSPITFIIFLTGNVSSEKGVVILSTLFKTQIKNIRKEAIELGFSITTMDSYLKIWSNFIKWKNEDSFIYNELEYSKFLLDYYQFNVNEYNNKSKSFLSN